MGLEQQLRKLGHYKRVLLVGAHPDDEDTELLTILVRGMGAEAAYLSLNRGEGGQNLIGPELGEELGLIRTEELLAARRLDGARQYFTRAYDFGFSKTLDETWKHWPRDSILKDVVRVVRRFRPQILVSVFSGTPRDGHGQHQAAGWATLEAFRAAGDSTRFAELWTEEGLAAWTPLKLYRSARFDTAATTLSLDGGALNPAVGQSYHQIAMRGRSFHRSQDMGQLQRVGPSTVRLGLLDDRTGGRPNGGLFAGIDTTLRGLPLLSHLPPARWEAATVALDHFAADIDSVRDRSGRPGLTSGIRGLLNQAAADLALAAQLSDTLVQRAPETAPAEISEMLEHLNEVRAAAAGLVVDALIDDPLLVPGEPATVTLWTWNTSAGPVFVEPHLDLHGELRGEEYLDPPGISVAPGQAVSQRIRVTVPADAAPTEPYFLNRPRIGDLYKWAPRWGVGAEPFDPPPLTAEFSIKDPDQGGAISLRREVAFRFNDQGRGEIRRPIALVPRIGVVLDPATRIWPVGSLSPRTFTVTLTHFDSATTAGTVRLQLPAGWPAVRSQAFRFTQEDEVKNFEFTVRAPAALKEGPSEIRAIATAADGPVYRDGVFTVDYPHIRPRQLVRPAVALAKATTLALPPLTHVGYVRGAADRVPEALQEAGVPIVLLDQATLERGNLSRFGAIVIGSRAYETDPALNANNERLLNYVRAGGLLITQYQQYPFFEGLFAPFPLAVGGQRGTPGPHDRVTDETAPVTMLRPTDPVLRWPNRIGPRDWAGWTQERGLYFAHSWDPAYTPLLEMHDADGPPLEGGLLVARVGKGTYVYTGLSFFRQLPAGVPGAFRLFANLLALGSSGAQGGR